MYIINSHDFVQEVVKKVYHTLLAIAWLVLTRYMQFFCQAISKKGNIIVSRSVTCQDRTDDELLRILLDRGRREHLFLLLCQHMTHGVRLSENRSYRMGAMLILWFNHVQQNSMDFGFAKPFFEQCLLNIILFQ